MSIKGCPDCNGTGWLPKEGKDKNWHPEPHVPEGLPPSVQWESCWCNYGKVTEEQPAFWKDRERVQEVFSCSYEDLEKAVSNFLKHIEPYPEQIKLLKFYIAQWVTKDPQPPLGWLEKLARSNDWKSLKEYVAWLATHVITPL